MDSNSGVYLAHFERPYHHAKHYMGWSSDIAERVQTHKAGRGARLMEVISEAGIDFKIVRVWPGLSRDDERRLKRQKNSPRMCPVCKGVSEYGEIQSLA